jgi:hypothetical protein
LRAANHVLGGAPREGEHQNPRRIDPVEHQMGGAMRQRIGLSRSGAGQDQHGTCGNTLVLDRGSKGGGAPLLRVECVEHRCRLGLHHM